MSQRWFSTRYKPAMSLNTTAIIGSKQAPGATSAKACPRGRRFDERSMKSLFDFREKRLKRLDDLGLQVADGIGWPPRGRQKRLTKLPPMFGLVGARGVLNALANIDSFVQNVE